MNIAFTKYQGAGNDFVMIDNRSLLFPKHDKALVARMCNRRFGIGADGLILLEMAPNYDFRMVYFNADGSESSMCGNGGRCITAFAKQLGVIDSKANFIAIDGPHEAEVLVDGQVALGMIDVNEIEEVAPQHFLLNTGSPHYVIVGEQMPDDLVAEARKIRNSDRFLKEGVNVNFIHIDKKNQVQIRTYERGVEDETLACGTGSVAAAIVASKLGGSNTFKVDTQGGALQVSFDTDFKHVLLQGDATRVFEGIYSFD